MTQPRHQSPLTRTSKLLLICCTLFSIYSFAGQNPNKPVQTLFTHVNVFNGTDDKLYKDHNVLVEGNTIKSISATVITANKNATIIDGKGRTLMPGLIDAHVHLNMQLLANPKGIVGVNDMTWEEVGALAKVASDEYLYSGFTTVRDLCGTSSGLRKHINAGTISGPRIYISGACISQTSGHGDWRPDSAVIRQGTAKSHSENLGLTVLADGADEVLKATRNNLAGGADFTKMMAGGGVSSDRDPLHSTQGTMEELQAMVKANKHFGTIGAVHAYTDLSVQRALKAGIMSIEHGNLMTKPESFKLLAKKGAWIIPAIGGFADELLDHPYYGNPANPAYHKSKQIMANKETWIKLANKYKVNMGFGTDVVAAPLASGRNIRGFQITQWVNAFGKFKTLKAMTSDNGKLMALTGKKNPYPKKLGVIEKGAYADIILVDGNPLDDLSVLGAIPSMFKTTPRSTNTVKTIPFVMKDGKVFRNEL